MKLLAVLVVDSGWVDTPDVSPAYVFNNMRDLVNHFNELGIVEIIKEPNPNNVYEFGQVILTENDSNCRLNFDCIYGENL